MKNMMKKIVCGAAALATLVTSAAFCSTTASAAKYGPLTYVEKDGILTITGCDKNAVNVYVPTKINGKFVNRIGANAFKDCTKLETLRLSRAIFHIYNNAFENCTKLKEIYIPMSTLSLGDNAFKGCNNLKLITFDICDVQNFSLGQNALPNRKSCNIAWRLNYEENNKGKNNALTPKSTVHYYRFGDVNNDKDIDMVDSQMILKYYAEIVAGNASESDSDWYYNKAMMDVDHNGSVDAMDAQYTFGYYMDRLSQKTTLPFDLYMYVKLYDRI